MTCHLHARPKVVGKPAGAHYAFRAVYCASSKGSRHLVRQFSWFRPRPLGPVSTARALCLADGRWVRPPVVSFTMLIVGRRATERRRGFCRTRRVRWRRLNIR